MTRLLGFTTFFLLICFMPAFAQKEPKSVKKRQEQLERQEAEKKKAGEKAHEEGVEKGRDGTAARPDILPDGSDQPQALEGHCGQPHDS